MRKLKFRAWDKEKKQWLYDFEFAISGEGETFLYTQGISEDGYMRLTEDLEIVQYTGLKDKNDKEIYEGDIIKFLDYTIDIYRIGVVYYDVTEFRIKSERDYFFNEVTEMEIIGNKYEHPNLLKVINE